jgi:hypothetical protein
MLRRRPGRPKLTAALSGRLRTIRRALESAGIELVDESGGGATMFVKNLGGHCRWQGSCGQIIAEDRVL